MLLLIEGFDTYHTSVDVSLWANLQKRWALSAWSTYYKGKTGRWAGLSLECVDKDIYIHSKTLPTSSATVIVGFNAKWTSLGNSYAWVLCFYGNTAAGPRLCLTSGGELQIRDQYGTLIGTTTGANIQANVWSHIEVKMICGAAGSAVVRVNGITKLTTGTFDSRIASETLYRHLNFQGTPTVYFDDIYCCDGSGSLNNDFLGVKQVVAIMPNAAGDSTQWTPSAGDNYATLDERPPSEADYVQTDTPNNLDLYNFEALSSLTGGVVGVQLNVLVKSTVDGFPWTVKFPFKGTAQSDGDDVVVTSGTSTYMSRLLETNPDTGNPWELSEINAAQFGLKLVS